MNRFIMATFGAVLVLCISPPQARAQDRGADRDLEEVIVTGYRRSLQDSISLKRDSSLIVEALSAEEIGKLPDVSIAESLARLPGLAGQRLNGRSQVISVRGLSPDFTTTLLNGRQQVSVGDNRGVEYDQYPSGLISNVLVYKTPAASLLNQGLAGTVDLRTIRPLALNDRTISVNARYVRNAESGLNRDGEDSGGRFNVFYADQFAEGTVGVGLGLFYLSNPSQGEQHRAWGYPTVGDDDLVIGGVDSLVRSSELERTAIMGVVEFRPRDNLAVDVDLYYSKFEEQSLLRGPEFGLQWAGGGALDNETVDDGFVVSGVFPNRHVLFRNDINSRETDLFAIGVNAEYLFANGWSAALDFGHSQADREDMDLETYSGTGSALDADRGVGDVEFVSGSQGTRFQTLGFNYADISAIRLANPHGWAASDERPGGQAGFLKEPEIDDALNQFSLTAEREIGTFGLNAMKFGIQFSERTKDKVSNEWFLGFRDAAGAPISSKPLPEGAWLTSLDFIGIPGMASYDPRPLLDDGTYALLRHTHPDITEKAWRVEEQVVTLFSEFGVDTVLGARPLSGNFGVQVVFSDQHSDAEGSADNSSLVNQIVPVSGGKSYTDLLPSASLNLELADNQILRLGVARTLARARMDQMRASRRIREPNVVFITSTSSSPPDNFWSAEGGNPDLDPWVANAVDLSWEFYFPNQHGYFALAGYYKDLESWVYDGQIEVDFSAVASIVRAAIEQQRAAGTLAPELAELCPTATSCPAATRGAYSTPLNGDGGKVYGFETALTVNGDMVHPALKPLGLIFNFSYNKSSVRPTGATMDTTLPGLSKRVGNMTLFYERQGLAARISGRFRSEYIGEVIGFGADLENKLVDDEFVVDAQVSYAFDPDGELGGLSVFLQGTNINDEPFFTYTGDDKRQVENYQKYGATWIAGINYKL